MKIWIVDEDDSMEKSPVFKWVLPSDYKKNPINNERSLERLLGEDSLNEESQEFMLRRVAAFLESLEINNDNFMFHILGSFSKDSLNALSVYGLYEELNFNYKDVSGTYYYRGRVGDRMSADVIYSAMQGNLRSWEEDKLPSVFRYLLVIGITMNQNKDFNYKEECPFVDRKGKHHPRTIDLADTYIQGTNESMNALKRMPLQSLFDLWASAME
jgi:hypothetical protein